jgi:uncharacterized Zn-finger protein
MSSVEAKNIWGNLTHVTLDMTSIECGGCGIPFAVPTNYYQKLVENHGSFHCPNGCSRKFTKQTEAEKLKEKLALTESALNQKSVANIQLEDQLNKANKKLKRLHEGKCPCCDKTYKHLAAHMKKMHPDRK